MDNNTNKNNGLIWTVVVVVLVVVAIIVIASTSHKSSDQSSTATSTDQNAAMNPITGNSAGGTTSGQSATGASAGVMVGGAMMTPDKDIVANAMQAANLTELVAAVQEAGLVDTLKGAGPYTVFAPDNNALNKLPAAELQMLLKPENKAKLAKILEYHVVAGRYTSSDLKDNMSLKTLEGDTIKINITNTNGITVNGVATVEVGDILSSNGISFVIDTVLTPPGVTL